VKISGGYYKMEDKRRKLDDSGSIPLYIGASALFISLVTVIFFYREIRKIKKDYSEIKQIKNQISNVDNRFDIIESSIEDLVAIIKNKETIINEQILTLPTVEETSDEDEDNEKKEN